MNISSLAIRGFRNLPDVTVDFESDFTVLVGDNNSGKTNILDALYAALRVNRTIKQGAFDLHDYHLASGTAMAGDAGPIELTLRFEERAPEEWQDDIISEFSDVLALDVTNDRNSVTLRVMSTAPGAGQEETYEWAFLNEKREPLTKRRYISEINALQRLRPFYQLGALRDVSREFTKRSTYFSPFVTDPTFNDDLRTELSESLASINERSLRLMKHSELCARTSPPAQQWSPDPQMWSSKPFPADCQNS